METAEKHLTNARDRKEKHIAGPSHEANVVLILASTQSATQHFDIAASLIWFHYISSWEMKEGREYGSARRQVNAKGLLRLPRALDGGNFIRRRRSWKRGGGRISGGKSIALGSASLSKFVFLSPRPKKLKQNLYEAAIPHIGF